MPAKPAAPPEIAKTASVRRASEKPAKRAARGLAPTARTSKPNRVRARTRAASATARPLISTPAWSDSPSISRGSRAASSKLTLCGKL